MHKDKQQLVGHSAEYLRVMRSARMVAVTDTTVLIRGEKGTGKQSMATEMHHISLRRRHEFRTLNCSVKTEQALEELLGDDVSGLFNGTLFLDEVGDLSSRAQAALMALLQQQERTHHLRIIASTSIDLSALVQQGVFREDLYYRFNIVPLELPPLRERVEDIVPMLKQFTQEFSRSHGRKAPVYSISARNLLKRYGWPGNIRELRNFCERMVILLAGQKIQPENLPPEMLEAKQGRSRFGFILPDEGINLLDLEGDVIRQALEKTRGNRSGAARLLGISRDTLLYRIQKHAIDI